MENYFWGYKRPDGRFGVRNHVAIISASDNANFIGRNIADAVNGAVAVPTGFGRGEFGEGLKQHVRTLGGMGANPNVYAAIVVSLEPVMANRVADFIKKSGKRVEVITSDTDGSTIDATAKGIKIARQMVIDASCLDREKVGLEHLMLGVECGGSDTTSGVISNPATGLVADKVVDAGGTVILSETAEWTGAEHLLAQRAVSEELSQEIIEAVNRFDVFYKNLGVDMNANNPSPDNQKGGLTTIEEKSLGAIKKGGSRPVQAIYKYAEHPDKKGLVLMDAISAGVENITGLAGAGCQIIIFSTGKGNPIGNPVVPTIKASGNPRTVTLHADNTDVDLSAVVTEQMPIEQAGDLLYDEMLLYAKGKVTSSEVLDDLVVSVSRNGKYVYGY